MKILYKTYLLTLQIKGILKFLVALRLHFSQNSKAVYLIKVLLLIIFAC